MKNVAPGIARLDQYFLAAINVYVAGDMLIDAGSRLDGHRIRKQLRTTQLSRVVITHVHPDHQGIAAEICTQRAIPLACHADDVDAMEGRRSIMENEGESVAARISTKLFAGPPHPVSEVLHDGDHVGEFRVVHTPGHSRGHMVLFRESDRVAICGDVVRNMSYLTGRTGIRQPPDDFTYDPAENRRSIRKLAALKPSLILPGHGPEITDMAAFVQFVDSLPSD